MGGGGGGGEGGGQRGVDLQKFINYTLLIHFHEGTNNIQRGKCEPLKKT